MSLVFMLMLGFLSSYTGLTSSLCYAKCPPGYYKIGDCNDSVAMHRCEKCENNTFTADENTITKCQRCHVCEGIEIQLKACSFNSDVVCDCKEDYYRKNTYCTRCPCYNCEIKRNSRMYCTQCKSQCTEPDCRRKCLPNAILPADPATTWPTLSQTTTTTASNRTSNPVMHPVLTVSHMPWLFLVGVLVTFLMVIWLLWLFVRNPFRYSCPCWSASDPANEDPKANGSSLMISSSLATEGSHRGSSPTTQALAITDEIRMMNQSPATLDHPNHITPLLTDTEDIAARQEERWPAIVLYAIIKEVPLRRWKEFLRLLSVADRQLERVELEAGSALGSMEKQYQMLRLWSQCSTANMSDVFSALHHMDLSGCAQLLQESLEKLQQRSELEEGLTDHDLNGSMQTS